MKNITTLGCLLLLGASVSALEIGKKPNTPKIPNVPYHVHDGTRPVPPVVENAGAVEVKPPKDAIVLFDGTNLDAWNTKDNFLIKDGILVANKGGIHTKESFGDIQVHIEWRVPAGRKVKSQSGGNSGIFINRGFEIQILQSHDNLTYPDGSAGSLYGQTPPLVNATTKQGDWQSYDIIFHKAKFDGKNFVSPAYATVIHNGVVLHSHRAFHGPTTYRKVTTYNPSHAKDGPISLQWHSDPLEFRNIWVRKIGDYDTGKVHKKGE